MATQAVSLKPFNWLKVEPVGYWYAKYKFLKDTDNNIVKNEVCAAEIRKDTVPNLATEIKSIPPDNISLGKKDLNLALLDPTAWKSQDHYNMLGLEHLRYKATSEDIKTAYRNMAIKFHPDKKDKGLMDFENAPALINEEENSHFECIKIAFNILSNPAKRKTYDSCDSEFDDSIPIAGDFNDKNFLSVFGPVFERNSHFSQTYPIPPFGDAANTSDEQVEEFYRFWFEFKSWREYSYSNDEENDHENAENREEKRWLEKQNKANIVKQKRQETQRIMKLVELAYNNDPRIKRIQTEEKQRKDEEKRLKAEKQQKDQEERQQKIKEAEEKELFERGEKARIEKEIKIAERKDREEKQNRLKQERKRFNTACGEHNNFAENSSEFANNLIKIEELSIALCIDELCEITEKIQNLEGTQAKLLFEDEINKMTIKQEEEINRSLSEAGTVKKTSEQAHKKDGWSQEEYQLLVKAMTLYPVGTSNRWEVIANFINKHSSTPVENKKSGKEVISKVKSMQKFDFKEEQTGDSFTSFNQIHSKKLQQLQISSDKTINYDTAAASNIPHQVETRAPKRWENTEQKLLEQGLKTFLATDTERWQKIANLVGTRTEKECKLRFKEIVESIQAKKVTQQNPQK